MPAIANIRRERFARHFIKTGNASKAYRFAGFSPRTPGSLWTASSRLLRHVEVASRIAELRRQMTYKTKISLESLLNDLAEDRALARELGQPSAAIQATTMAAKLVGLMVERKESGGPGDFASLTAEQVIEQVRKDHGADVAKLFAKALDTTEQAEPDAPAEIPTPASDALN